MRRLASAGAAVAASLGAWCALGAVAIGPGLITASRFAVLPPAWVLGALLVVSVGTVLGLRVSPGRVAPLYGTLACVLPYVPGAVPASLLAWQGLLAVPVWAAAIAAVIASHDGHSSSTAPAPRRLVLSHPVLAPVLAGLIATCASVWAWQSAYWWVPGGDEPHYLVITQSVLRDGDLAIQDNHERGDYGEYFSGVLRPDFLNRGKDGRIYSIHAPGLPVAVLPAFAVGGYPAVVVLLIVCYGLASALAWRIGWRATGDAAAAWVGWAGTTLTWPVLAQSFTVYPDGASGMLLLVGAWLLLEAPSAPPWRLAMGSVALAALPWMHTRVSVLAAAMGVAVGLRLLRRPDRTRALAAFAAVPVASAIAWFSFFEIIYGTWNPTAPYGHGGHQASLHNVATGMAGLLFDQQFGLLPAAPVFALAAVGVVLAIARSRSGDARRLAVEWSCVVTPYVLVVAAYPMWFGGASSPARFLVPILLTSAVPMALAWRYARSIGTRTVMLGLVLVSGVLALAAFAAGDGQFAITQRATFGPLVQWATRAADLPLALPSVLRGDLRLALAQASAWTTAVVALALVLRAGGTSHARACTLAVPLAVLVVSLALQASWRLAGTTGIRPVESRNALLRAAWPGGIGATFDPRGRGPTGVRTSNLQRMLPAIPLESSDRDGSHTSLPAFDDLPAGRYRVEAVGITPGAEVRVVAGARPPLAAVSVPAEPAGMEAARLEFDVPLPLSRLTVDAVPRTPTTSLQLVALALRRSFARSGERARTATRYGPVTAFVISERAFVEPDGMWLRPGRSVFVLQAENGAASIRAIVRNPPVDNRVEVRTPDWERSLALAPGLETVVEIPVPGGQHAVRVEFDVANGIRPKDLDPSSADTRRLGAWLGFPD